MVVVVVCFNPCFVVPFKTVFALGFPVFGFAFGLTVFAFALTVFGLTVLTGFAFAFSAGCRVAKRRLFACGS